MDKYPKVSILCITYNQEKYIRQALESFVSQKTDFSFEILIHDDASSDGTQNIINEFKNNYPGIIRTFFQKENQYSKGVRGIMTKFLLPEVRGKYIALCEGDDFFTDEKKLQIQVDFLDKHSDCSICFHPVRVFFENNDDKDHLYPNTTDGSSFTLKNLLKWNFIQTNSVMYRRQNYDSITQKNIMPNDWYLHIYHARFGNIGFINKTMSAYRRHPAGIWWSSFNNHSEIFKKNSKSILSMYLELIRLIGDNGEYKKIITDNIDSLFGNILEIKNDINEPVITDLMIDFKEEIASFMSRLSKKITINENNLAFIKSQLIKREEEIESIRKEIDSIRSSKFWKFRNKCVSIKNRIRFILFSPKKFIKKYLGIF